jgi:di/tricarboxylate transporter
MIAAPWIMPDHAPPTCEIGDRADRRYLADFIVPADSPLIGTNPLTVFNEGYPSFEVFEVARDYRILYPERDRIRLSRGDTLFVKGSPNDLVTILNEKILELSHALEEMDFEAERTDSMVAEFIIPPQSSFLGERLLETSILEDPELHIIAVKRRSLLYTEQRIQNMKLRVGDILLVRCPEKKLEKLRGEPDFIIVEDIHHEIIHKKKAPMAFAIFLGLIAAVSTGIADIMVCALAAVFLLILGGCIHLRDAYRSIQGNVLLLIAGTIALGVAMEKTGASRLYAEKFLLLFQGLGPTAILCGILLLTSASTQLLSNNATAVLLVPIALSTALALGVNPKPFILAVCFGASACFATPIGYQTNLLVFGPGGYRFNDYLKLGIPLNLLVLIMGTLFIPLIWPF